MLMSTELLLCVWFFKRLPAQCGHSHPPAIGMPGDSNNGYGFAFVEQIILREIENKANFFGADKHFFPSKLELFNTAPPKIGKQS